MHFMSLPDKLILLPKKTSSVAVTDIASPAAGSALDPEADCATAGALN
jgi:hypothetical protein